MGGACDTGSAADDWVCDASRPALAPANVTVVLQTVPAVDCARQLDSEIEYYDRDHGRAPRWRDSTYNARHRDEEVRGAVGLRVALAEWPGRGGGGGTLAAALAMIGPGD